MANDLEKRFEFEILPSILKLDSYTFPNDYHFKIYQERIKWFKRDGLNFLIKNAPKVYGKLTNTEFVILSDKIFWRIDCKFQKNKYSHITIDSIRGEIDRNTVDNNLYEDCLIFVVDGEGINWDEIKNYRKRFPDRIQILSIKEFKKFLKQNIN